MKKVMFMLVLLMTISNSLSARYFDPEQGRFNSRDPLVYIDGMNLYAGYFAQRFQLDPSGLKEIFKGELLDDGGGHIRIATEKDYLELGLPVPAKAVDAACEVRVDIGHTDSHVVPKKKCLKYGAVGCSLPTDELNEKLIKDGRGIIGIPKNNGDFVGPGPATPGRAPETDARNGNYPRGTIGFTALLSDAWKAAIKTGKSFCKQNCCKGKRVKVMMRCNSDHGKRIMRKHKIYSWCNKTLIIKCE